MKLLTAILTLVISTITYLLDEYTFVPGVYAAVVQPEKPNSVLPYRNNEKAQGRYTFFFKVSSQIESNPLITIDFPVIYVNFLPNIEKCSAKVQILLRSETQFIKCTVDQNKVTFDLKEYWSEIDSGNIIIDLYDVINPVGTAISTGNFAIKTFSGEDLLIDENIIFEGIGFAPYYGTFTSVTMVNDGANIAGYVTNYILTFTLTRNLPKSSWFRLEFPTGFGFGSNLECYVEQVADNLASLPCYTEDMTLMMKDLKFDMTLGSTYRIKIKNIRNPFIATAATGSFVFETMKEGVNTVIEYEGAVPGISISPGGITDVTIIGFPLVQNLFVDYYIKFLPQNAIPKGGQIEIDFPDTFQGLDSTCRVVSGLKEISSSSPITATTTFDKIWIRNFDNFDPKYIEVKCFCTNPPMAGETPHWQIRTYQDTTLTKIIDQNLQAGTVPISSIDRPNFFASDLYEKIVNCSWLEQCPIDFRFFPNPGNFLTKYNTATNYGNLALQIPLWWWLYSNSSVPECKFGENASAGCQQNQHIFSIQAPREKDYEYCELPVSVKYARMTPIPFKYPFRILSFQNGGKWYPNNNYATPKEQDTYIMDIPIVSISVLQTYVAASESGDLDNLLHIRANFHPFLFSTEGAITVNVSSIHNSYDDSSAWPLHVGTPAVGDNQSKEFPCKVYITGTQTGYKANFDYHPNIRCYIRTGNLATNTRTLIQIVGFQYGLEKGNYFEVYLPRVGYCQTVGRKCKVTVTYTMTHDLDYPYITNRRENDLGVVLPPPSTFLVPNVSPTNVPWRARYKCEDTEINMNVRVLRPIQIGDYIVLKKSISHWHDGFLRRDIYRFCTGGCGNDQDSRMVYDYEFDTEYIIVQMFSQIPSNPVGSTTQFRFRWNINTPYANNEAWMQMYAWSGRTKIIAGNLPPTLISLPGGINDFAQYWNDALDDRHVGVVGAISGYHRPARIRFMNCMEVPYQGEIKISFNVAASENPVTQWGEHINYCRVWRQVTKQYANETHVRCDYNDATNVMSINTFDTIPKRLQYIYVHWPGSLKLKAQGTNVGSMRMTIETFNITNDATTRTDWVGANWSPVNINIGGFNVPKKVPPHYKWHKMKKYQYEIYRNLVGSYIFDIEVGDLMEYTAAENNYFEFRFHNSIQLTNQLECRYAAYAPDKVTLGHHFPSVACNLVAAGHVRMRLHPYLDIHAATRYQFIIDSRNMEINEGWQFTQVGIYTLGIDSFINGLPVRSQKQRFEVYGDRIEHFFIYQANRIVGEPGLYIIWADFFANQGIVTSDDTASLYWTLAAYFETANNGFKQDLGTGWPDQSQVPCNLLYLALRPTFLQPLCYLYYGYNDAPARIEVKGFAGGNSRFIRLDLPGIETPVTAGLVPRVWFKVLETTVAAGVRTTATRFEGHYYELNNTWTRYNPWYWMETLNDNTGITQGTTALDTLAQLRITLRTPQRLHENDYIIIKFPKFFPVPYQMDYTDCGNLNVKDRDCYSIRNTPQDYHIVYNKFNANGLVNNQVAVLNLESARATVTANNTHDYFETFVYHDGRLIGRYRHYNIHTLLYIADVITPTINCLPINPIQFTDTEYIVRFSLPHDLLSKSEIRIDYPLYDLTTSITCQSTTNSMLTGALACDIKADPLRFSSTYNYNAALLNDLVEIKIPLKNQAQGASPFLRQFRVRTYYIKDNGYYYCNGDSGMVDHASNCKVLATPPVLAVRWPEMFHTTDRTRCGQIGPILFIFKSGYTLTMNTLDDFIEVKIPISFVKTNAEFVGQWNDDYGSSWTFTTDATHNIARIRAPKTKNINANEFYTMNVTTLNGINEINGFVYPATQGTYYAIVSVYKANVKVEESTAKIFSFKQNFQRFESQSYVMNAGFRASFVIKLTTGAAYGAGGKFIFRLPTATYLYKQSVNLFDEDAGRGYTSGTLINCHYLLPIDSDNNNYVPVTCRFYRGSQANGIPAYVEMTGVPAITATQILELTFDGFTHPATGNDNKNVESSLEYYNSANALQFTGIDYDYTIVTDSRFDTLTNYSPAPSLGSPIILTPNGSFTIRFRSPIALNFYDSASGLGWGDYIIIEFPVGYVGRQHNTAKAKLIAANAGASADQFVKYSSGNNWVIWRPDINLAATTEYTLQIQGIDQAQFIPSSIIFKTFIVSERRIVRVIQYTPVTTLTPVALSTITILADQMPQTDIPLSKYQKYKLEFTPPASASIPAGGSILVIVPAALTVTDLHCNNTATSNLLPATGLYTNCVWDGAKTAFKITNLQATTGNIGILFHAISQATNPGTMPQITIQGYRDVDQSFMIFQGTVNIPSIKASLNGFTHLKFSEDHEEVPDVVRAGNTHYLEVDVSIPTGFTATSNFVFSFSPGFSVPTGAHMNCHFDTFEARRCEITQASPLIITVTAPYEPALTVGTKYLLRISSTCGSNNARGITFPATVGIHYFDIAFSASTQRRFIRTYSLDFTFKNSRALMSNVNADNAVAVTLTLRSAIPAGGKIRFKLPRLSTAGRKLIWISQGVEEGQELENTCQSLDTGVFIPSGSVLGCYYYQEASNNVWEMHSFNSISAGAVVPFIITNLKNPNFSGDHFVIDAIVESVDQNNVILDQGVIFDLFGVEQITSALRSSSSPYVRSADTLVTSGVNFRFNGIDLPAAMTMNDYILFEFDTNYNHPNPLTRCTTGICAAACVDGTFQSLGRYVIYRPRAAGVSGTIPVCFSNGQNPIGASSTSVKAYAIYSRSAVAHYNFNHPGSFTIIASSATMARTVSTAGAASKYTFTITSNAFIPAYGGIRIAFPSTFAIHGVKIQSGLTLHNNEFSTTVIATTRWVQIKLGTSRTTTTDIIIDVWVTNGAALTTPIQIVAHSTTAYNSRIFDTTVAVTGFAITSTETLIDCQFDILPLSDASGATTTWNLKTPVPVTFTSSTTLPSNSGIEILTYQSATEACYGLSVYSRPTALGGAIELGHSSLATQANLNYMKWAGNLPTSMIPGTHYFSVDFANHDQTDLGTGLTNGAAMPCHLQQGTTIILAICRLRIGIVINPPAPGRVLLPPGIEVFPRNQVPSGTATTLVVSRFLNPVANILLEVRVRLLRGTTLSIPVDMFADVAQFTLTADIVTPFADPLTITGTSQSQTGVQIDFAPVTAVTGNKIILFAPYVLGGKSTYLTPVGFTEYYPSAGVYVATGAATITSTNFELPAASTASSTWSAIDVNTAQVMAVYTLTPSSPISSCALTSPGVTAMTKSNATGVIAYRITWTSSCVLPASSSVQVTLPAYISAVHVGKYELISGTVSGSIYIKTNTVRLLTITGYNQIGSGLFDLVIWVQGTVAVDTTTSSISARLNNLVIFEDLALATPHLTSNSLLMAEIFRDFLPYMKPVLLGSSGYIKIDFQTSSAITTGPTPNRFILIPPSVAPYSNDQDLSTILHRCKFRLLSDPRETQMFSKYCFFDNTLKVWIIRQPTTFAMSQTQIYRLEIFTASQNNVGLTFPNTINKFTFNFQHVNSASTVLDYFMLDLIYSQSRPAYSCFKNFLSNSALKNAFMVRLRPAVAIPAGSGFVEVHFPTTVLNGMTVNAAFARDLGTGIFNQHAIKCKAWTISGTTKTAWGGITNCILNFGGGSNQLHRSAFIEMVPTSAMSTGTTYVIDFYGIVNPALNQVLTELRVYAGHLTSGVKQYTNTMLEQNHIYTSNPTITVETAQTLPTITPTEIQLSTNFNLAVNTAGSITLEDQYDHVRMLYNLDMYNPAVTAVQFETFDIETGLALFYSQSSKSTNFNLQLSNMMTPSSAKPVFTSQFQVDLIKDKVITRRITYNPGASTFVGKVWTTLNVVPATINARANDKSPHTLNLVLSKILKKSGSIEIEVKNMAGLDTDCKEVTAVLGSTFTCKTVSATKLRITSIVDLAVGTNIQIDLRATATAATTGQICATAWEDSPVIPTAQTDAVQLEVCQSLTYNTVPAIPWLEARTPMKRWRVQAQERGMLTFKFDTGGTTINKITDFIWVNDPTNNFGAIDTRDFVCFFDDFVATSCVYSQTNRRWVVGAPRSNNLNGVYTLTIISYRQWFSKARVNGILFPIELEYAVTLTGQTSTNALVFTDIHDTVYVPPWKFSTVRFNSYLIKIGSFTTMNMRFTANRQILATTGGQIKIDFKIKDRYLFNVFSQDLGTALYNGQDYDCPAVPVNVVKCRLFWGNDNTAASIILDPQANINIGSPVEVNMPALFNPTLDFTEVKILVTAQNLVSGAWVKQSEHLNDIYVAVDSTVVPILLPAPAIADVRTGAVNSVTWTFTPTNTIKHPATSFDKVVLLVDKAVLEHIVNTKPTFPLMACPGFTYKIFYSVDMIEFTPSAALPAGTPVNLVCNNFYTPQYVIRGGMKFLIETWIDGQVDQKFEYGNIFWTPNILTFKNIVYSSQPSQAETLNFETYTFTFKPTNYIKRGGKIEIYFDQDFAGMTNCKILGGLNGGVCRLLNNFGGSDIIRLEQFGLYYPVTDPNIRISVDMTNVPTPRTVDFRYRSIWIQDDITPTLEDLIDDDLIGSITYIGLTPYTYLDLNKMYIYTREACWNRDDHGTFQFEVAFSSTISWTAKEYIVLYPWEFDRRTWDFSTDPYISEFLCYFDFDDIKFSAKSERCYYTNNYLYIWPPEETDLPAGNRMMINIDWRGQRDRGVSTWLFPKERHIMVYTNSTVGTNAQEVGPLDWLGRACYFGNRDYADTDWNTENIHSFHAVDYFWEQYNNGMNWNGRDHRLQLQYSLFNEMKQTSYTNLGCDELTVLNQTKKIPCMYASSYDFLNWPNLIWGWDNICEVYNVRAPDRTRDGLGLDQTAVITFNNITYTVSGDEQMRWGVPGIRNYIWTAMQTANDSTIDMGARNTFTHITVQSQVQLADGNWWDTHRVNKWYHIGQILTAHGQIEQTGRSSMDTVTYGNIHIYQTVRTTPPSTHGGSFLYYMLEDPWWFHPRNRTHGSRYCQTLGGTNLRCLFYDIPFRWVLYYVPANTGGYENVRNFGMMESPSFCITKPFWTYLASGSILRYILRADQSVNCIVPHIILEMELRDNPENQKVYYRVGVLPFNYDPWIKYVRFWIPQSFPTAGPHCRVNFGFRIKNIDNFNDKMKCQWSTSVWSGITYHHLEFFYIDHYSRRWWDQYDALFIYDVDLQNPVAPGWTQPWIYRTYDNYNGALTNFTRMNQYADLGHDRPRTWVGKTVPVANYFRVFRNRETFEERRLKAGMWGELHVRIYPKSVIPKDIGRVELQIPTDYDIPNGGTNICEVGHENHVDLAGQFCEISNERKISVRTNRDFGLKSVCTIVRITTDGAVGFNDGFQTPPISTSGQFDIYLWDNTRLVEFMGSTTAPKAAVLRPGIELNMTTSINEINQIGILNVSLHATVLLRAGYDFDPLQTDPFKKNPQGRIVLNFNRRDRYLNDRLGFTDNLGQAGAVLGVPFPVKCVAMNNLQTPNNEDLKCMLQMSTLDNFYFPSTLTVSNFMTIPNGAQFVQFHVLDIAWVRASNNRGWVEFSAYELRGDGVETPVFDVARVEMLAQPATGIVNVNINSPPATNHPIFSPNFVGSRLTLTFPVSIPGFMFQGDVFEVTFPSLFVFPDYKDLSAVFRITKSPYGPTDTYFFPADIVMYKMIQQVHFVLPRTYNIFGCTILLPCNVNIVSSGFRHIAYASPTQFDINMRVIRQQLTYRLLTYKNINPPPVATFNSLLATISSQFSRDVYVTYDFSFTPSYFYPANSRILIDLEFVKFRHIDKSNPKAVCSTNFNSIIKFCKINEAQVEIELNAQMNEGFAAVVTLTGVKNPQFVGSTASTDMRLRAIHPTAFLINEGFFNVLTFKTIKNVDTLFFRINLTSDYETVTSDYTFVLQNTNRVPPQGTINIELPSDWASVLPEDVKISSLVGGFSKSKLIYYERFIREPNNNLLLRITIDFEWPARESLKIKLRQIINPKNLPLTGIFNAYTKYDSETIDKSDPTDPASRIKFRPYKSTITVWKSDWTPRNEVELSDYTVKMSFEEKMLANQCIQFILPDIYDSGVTDYTKVLNCVSTTVKFKPCTYKNNIIQMCLDQDIPEDQQFEIVLKGVTNPNYGSEGAIDISTSDAAGNIIQFSSKVVNFPSTKGPTPVPMTFIKASSYEILVKADYDFCMKAPGAIYMDSEVIIDFPKQFDIRRSAYTCRLGASHDSTNLPYGIAGASLTCTVDNNLRRFVIRGQTAAYVGLTPIEMCYRILEVENSRDNGESFNFIMRLYDKGNKNVKYKTVGILDFPSTLSYIRSGLRIFVDPIPNVPLGTQSNNIQVKLEKSVPYNVVLTPQAPGFRFEPETIDIKYFEGTAANFRIIPIDGTPPGEHRITWVKQEQNGGGQPQFSELPDTYFNLVQEPDYRQMRLTISQNVYRTPLDATSMPIVVELSHPSTKPVTVYYKTRLPFQPEFVKFGPESITFNPGETKKQFNYVATEGAVSGLIDLSLDSEFEKIYYMPEKTINFEVEDRDLTPPSIASFKQQSLTSTSMSMRASTDESTKVYYLASLKGTQPPSAEEMMDPAKRALSKLKPTTPEVQGSQTSQITKDTRTYVYHDTFLNLDNLLPDTEYDFFMLPVDLYGNIGEIKKTEFKTNPIAPAVTFNLKAMSAMTDDQIKNALSLVTAVSPDRFKINFRPNFATIGSGEQEVTDVLAKFALDYEIEILPDKTGKGMTSFDLLKMISTESSALFDALPQLSKDQNIGLTGREIFYDPQQFVYNPVMIDISNYDVKFNCSIQYTGTVYGVIQPRGEPSPSALQIRDGLTYQNFQVDTYYKNKARIVIDENKKYRIWPAEIMKFDFLFHSTEYVAYFIADRESDGEVRLMSDSQIVAVTVKTQREFFKVEDEVLIRKFANLVTFKIGLVIYLLLQIAW